MSNFPRITMDDMFNYMNTAFEKNLDDYATNFPPTDIYVIEEDGTLVFELAVAGYKPEDIRITFSGDSLQISDVKEGKLDKVEEKKRRFFKNRIARRDFSLKYSLAPGKFDTENAEASYADGILKIEIPRSQSSKPKELQIKLLTK